MPEPTLNEQQMNFTIQSLRLWNRRPVMATMVLFCWLGALTPALAQRFQGGVVAGINLSQIDGDRLAGFNQPGINAGGRVAAVLSERWQLSLELLFSQQGSHRTLRDDPSATLDVIRLNFVEVPVMINFLEWKLHIGAGLTYARLISYRVEDIFGADVTDSQDYAPNQLLFAVGATYFFTPAVGLNIGWNKAISNLQADSGAGRFIGRNIQVRGVFLF